MSAPSSRTPDAVPIAPSGGARPAPVSAAVTPRYRYRALEHRSPGRHAPAGAALRRVGRSGENTADMQPAQAAPAPDEIDRLLRLRQPARQYAADLAQFGAVLDHANICSMRNATAERPAMAAWWARLRNDDIPNAHNDLDRIDRILRMLFFDIPPAQRAAEWQRLSPRTRRDVNLMIDLGEVIRTSNRPNADISYQAIRPRLARVLENEARADRFLRASDTPALMSLAQILRETDAANSPYFENRVAIMPSDVCAFVKNEILQDAAAPAEAAWASRREQDLCALLHRVVETNCATLESNPLTLASLRRGIEGALQAEAGDRALLSDLFLPNGNASAIYHDGWVLRNAVGKMPRDLVAYLDAQAPPAFARLHHAYKLSLVRRKLYEFGEYPGDYRFGSIKRAMATVLMRTSSRHPAHRYVSYASPTELETHWARRMQDEIGKGNMPYMLEIIQAIYSERANGVEKWTARHYRAHYIELCERIEAALSENNANAAERSAAWQWLAGSMPGWRAASREFDAAISTKKFSDGIENAIDTLYRIAQATHFPRLVMMDSLTALGTLEFHPLLNDLPFVTRLSLSQAAKAFDYSAFRTEHIIADNDRPAFTLIQKMENTHYRSAQELRAAPFWTVETEAYKFLLANNITVEQMTEGRAAIYSNVHTGAYYQRARPMHEAFVTVIRNVDTDQLLYLPTGKVIKPFHLIKKSFREYNQGLPAHPYVIGSALQYMRDHRLPFLPSVKKKHIERIANSFRIPRITTELGTQLADELLGSLPILAPTLQLARAWLDGKDHKFYYVLLISRDILATAAMTKMTFAAYIKPLVSGMRLSASAVLAAKMLPSRTMVTVRRYRANSLGYAGFDLQRRKQAPPQKQHDIPLIGDQTRGYQSKTNRARSGGNAARRIAEEHRSSNATLTSVDDGNIDPDAWLDFMRIIAPTLEQNARQFHTMLKLGRSTQNAMLDMRFDNDVEDAGARAGLIGLTSADGSAWCDGQALEERQTVRDVMAWQIKSPDEGSYDRQAVYSNVRIDFADDVEASWIAHPAWRYDPLEIIEQAFDASPVLRQLFNAYDVQPVTPGSIRIAVDTECIAAEVSSHGSAIVIDLPANPDCLHFTMNARHVARQSITSALIESTVAALTSRLALGDLTPRNPARERGLRVWLANRIQLQIDPQTDPRVNAAAYPEREYAQHIDNRKIREAAELEDQYLERVNPEDPVAARAHRFPLVAGNPTIKAVKALAERIGLSAQFRSANADAGEVPAGASPDGNSRDSFLERFHRRFAIEVAHLSRAKGDQLVETSHFFFRECYANSPLFQQIFHYGLRRRELQWIIFPSGYPGDSGIEHDMLIPARGIINAGTENGLYLGLIEIRPNPNDTAHPLPTSSLRPLEPFRRMLDGVVAALIGDYAGTPRDAAFEHRGAIGWASDMILQQIMQDAKTSPNKRLVQIAVSASNIEDCRRLKRMAAQKREQARDEDAYLDYWFASAGRAPANESAPAPASSSMASP